MAETVNIVPPKSAWMNMQQGQQDPHAESYSDIQNNLQMYSEQAQQMAANNALANLQYQKSINEMPVQTDLSPLMALTDSWSGSKLAPSYKQPETIQQRRNLMQQLQSELAKNQEGMSGQQVQLLKAQLETQARMEDRDAQRDLTKSNREIATSIRGQARNDTLEERSSKKLRDAQEGWVKDPIAVEATRKFYEVDGVKVALEEAKTNPILRGVLPAKIARLQEKGVLTDQDILRYSGSSAFTSKWKQFLQGAEEGTITDENLGFFARVAQGFADEAEKAVHERATLHAKQYSVISGKPISQSLSDVTGNTLSPDILKPRKAKETAKARTTYTPGMISKGENGAPDHKFNGGDPTNAKNWEEVKK